MKSRMHSRKSHELGVMPGKFVVKEVGERKTRFIDLFLLFFIIGIFHCFYGYYYYWYFYVVIVLIIGVIVRIIIVVVIIIFFIGIITIIVVILLIFVIIAGNIILDSEIRKWTPFQPLPSPPKKKNLGKEFVSRFAKTSDNPP